ncbi:MAG: hypothetical protein VKO39_04225 [Cyanobacteriota bacterium]|nr:hypothetical protein [Cyanobacteriota bacterium]
MNAMTRKCPRFTPLQKAEAIALCQSEGLTILAASKNALEFRPHAWAAAFGKQGFYTWLHRQDNPAPRAREEQELGEAIEPIFKDYKERYGLFRIHQELRG